MMPDLTNLLPIDRLRALRQIYFLRLAVVSLVLGAGVIVVHGVLLMPSYLYLDSQVEERTTALAGIEAQLERSEEKQVSARIASLTADATYLARLADLPKASTAVSAVTELPRPGIQLTGFSFAPAEGGATMTVSGVATTREALRAYERVLSGQTYITSATLPISAYAKDSNITFTITLTGPFLP
jgi:Tfp pilus assembly protein PilN